MASYLVKFTTDQDNEPMLASVEAEDADEAVAAIKEEAQVASIVECVPI
jgi:hypothetical protein